MSKQLKFAPPEVIHPTDNRLGIEFSTARESHSFPLELIVGDRVCVGGRCRILTRPIIFQSALQAREFVTGTPLERTVE